VNSSVKGPDFDLPQNKLDLLSFGGRDALGR
jgi:hypothetical protein